MMDAADAWAWESVIAELGDRICAFVGMQTQNNRCSTIYMLNQKLCESVLAAFENRCFETPKKHRRSVMDHTP